ncbi:MAG: hypothetical protein Q9175_000167 [Cornicularia normoerica]
MSSNKIIQKVDLKKTVTKGSQAVRLSAATVTERWTRPAFAVQTSKDGFTEAVQNAKKPLPNGTTEIAMREADHTSDNDKRDHYSGVCYDEKGNPLGTEHFPRK